MKTIKVINKKLIVIGILLVLSLIILLIISNEDDRKKPDINNKETTTKIVKEEDEKIKLTNDEIIQLLSIYKDDAYEFIISDNKDNKYKVERKNIESSHIDMIFEVDAITSTFSITDIKPESKTVGQLGGARE